MMYVGIGIGVGAGVMLIIVLVIFCLRRRYIKKKQEAYENVRAESDGTVELGQMRYVIIV